nr:hypothetical protein [Pseudoalteromonas porphyrae]
MGEPFGQRMFGIYTALSPIYEEQPHYIGAALPKYQIDCCKINHERSTRPSYSAIFLSLNRPHI